MSSEVVAAIIAALVALVTSLVTGVLTWLQLKRDVRKWAVDLRTTVEVEHLKLRIEHFGRASEIIARFSSKAQPPLSPETAHAAARELNEWFYSLGGLSADKSTRGAILGLRQAALRWEGGAMPKDIWHWRDLALFYLRRDIHLFGLDDYDPDDTASSYDRLKQEMERLTR